MKYAIITGASSGIGQEFVRQLDQKGYELLLVARREDRLLKLKNECKRADIFVGDLSNEEQCYELFDLIKDKDIDLFINNAGFGDCGEFVETDLEKEKQMIQVNIKALHILMKLVLKNMVKVDHGRILNVASSAGLLPGGPYMSTYYATKSYVTSLTRGVSRELKDKKSHVYVGCLCPGPVDTEFNQVAQVEFALKGITPQYCVSYALDMMDKGKVTIVPSMLMKTATTAAKLVPAALCVVFVAYQQKKKIYHK